MNTATIIRAAPAITRNGLPGLKPYVYRGTGIDTLTPHLDTEELFIPVDPSLCHCDGDMRAYRQHLADDEKPCTASREAVNAYSRELARQKRANACQTCGYQRGGPNCKRLCRGAR